MRITLLFLIVLYFHPAILPQDKFVQTENLLNDAYKMEIFSGVVLIAEKEDVDFLKAYGYSDPDNQTLNSTDTKFNIGSIGKLFTQIMIAQLMQEGKLSLSDNLKKVYPIYNNDYDEKITIKQLLTFTSGLGDYFMIPEFRMHPDIYRATDKLVSLIAKQPLLFEPGTSNAYSNSGYAVLGGIIEKLTGKSYEENLKERILHRLGMNNSGLIYNDTKTENTAQGLIVNPDGSIGSTYGRLPNVPTAAGGMYSTAEDLLKLDRSFMNDNILLEDKYKVLLANRFDSEPDSTWQELIALKDFGNGYAGGSPGWNAIYDQNVDGKYTLLILSNFDRGAQPVAQRIASILKGEKYPPLKPALGRYIYETIKEKGTDDFVKNYRNYLSKYAIRNDRLLNRVGYQFLNKNMTDEAIAVSLVNTKLFPEIANTYDSLGEAYMVKGDKKLALENYRKSLKLNPKNKNAEMKIKELEKE